MRIWEAPNITSNPSHNSRKSRTARDANVVLRARRPVARRRSATATRLARGSRVPDGAGYRTPGGAEKAGGSEVGPCQRSCAQAYHVRAAPCRHHDATSGAIICMSSATTPPSWPWPATTTSSTGRLCLRIGESLV